MSRVLRSGCSRRLQLEILHSREDRALSPLEILRAISRILRSEIPSLLFATCDFGSELAEKAAALRAALAIVLCGFPASCLRREARKDFGAPDARVS